LSAGHGSFPDRPRAEAKIREDWFRSGKTKNPLRSSRLGGSRTPILTLFYRLHIFHAFMLKKLSTFFVERIKFVDFYGWMHF
jgi:hypothetical protein